MKELPDIVGTWGLVRTVARTDNDDVRPGPFGDQHAMGRVVFNRDGRMMAVLCDGRNELAAGVEREYSSYCGNYRFDGARLVTRADAASDPSRVGTDQVRDVRFEGALMVLQPPPREVNGEIQHRELFWERLSDV